MSISLSNISGYDPTSLYKSLFNKVDSNSDGGIDKSEFESAVSSMAKNKNISTDEADAMFSKLDADGNGTVSENEMMTALKTAGEQRQANMPPPPPPDRNGNGPDFSKMAKDLMTSLDTGGDGSIDKSEFTAALSAGQSSNSTNADTLFSKLDTNGDGKVDEAELTEALKNMKPPMPHEGQSADASINSVSGGSATTGTDRLLSDLVNSLASNSDKTNTAGSTNSSAQNSLFSDLISSLNSSSSSSSDLDNDLFSQLVQSLKSSTGSSDDQISTMFNDLLDYMKTSSLYSQSGSLSYGATSTQSLMSVMA
jgi:Ca2+-binding EF-hand superfamily protein